MDKLEWAEHVAASPLWRDARLLRRHVEKLPQPIRFLGVGAIGLATDVGVFTLAIAIGLHPLLARLASLPIATLVTWRLNRALTFGPSGRQQSEEALRYALVTAVAQGTNYAVFAALVIAILRPWPQAAVLAGAATAATFSYLGHRLFSFARRAGHSQALPQPGRQAALR